MGAQWAEFVANGEGLRAYYDEVPALDAVRLRSVNVQWRGPTVVLRLDLPRFPDRVPQEWRAGSADTLQLHLTFLAVADLTLRSWDPPTVADIAVRAEGHRRLRVAVTGAGVDLEFSCSDALLVRHLSVFRATADGEDRGRHAFLQPIDRRLYSELPPTWERRFYGE
ncbi:Imm50 family immunity protein [Streptomyces sp. LHD-70]|uniref:Imm50 family immunity protein n=1 Tax=Streptomyces sp. LHD-70 TaxID=3072140 RepID=UPI00280D0332|nr:Imm50 family immunity protein [Streptomyces sp. LHD-70]MDQ8706300.1 Imm50 family immunity protein [Streptomyces sp. LHD-70]